MNPRLVLLIGLAACSFGCDYSNAPKVPPVQVRSGPLPTSNLAKDSSASVARTAKPTKAAPDSPEQREKREAILNNVIRLIQSASITPGGHHFEIATQNLNGYFEGTATADYLLSPATRQYLLANLPDFPPYKINQETLVRQFESRPFDPKYDGRHLEDCMIYNEIANRVAGEGATLTRVRRIFDYLTRQVQVVPPQSLAPTGMLQAQARPYDVLLRGMAVEYQGFWTERGWAFMALCRQLGVDVGLVTYTPRIPGRMLATQPNQPQAQPVGWVCAALIDGKAYLFDQRLGLAIPDAAGDGVATLEEAMTNPQILERLDLPGQIPYGTTRNDLVNSPTKVGILIDSSPGYFTPKMRLLQSRLTGKNRTILYADPIEQRDRFVKVLGLRAGNVGLWLLPLRVHVSLFNDGAFVGSTQVALRLFDDRLPLLYARVAQLKGQIPEAISQYVAFRLATGGVMRDKKTPIVPPLQHELDLYSTYFLALCHLEQGNRTGADFFFNQTLKLTPEPSPKNREYCYMFRWGAFTNLGLLAEARGDLAAATRYLSELFPTVQVQGNLWLARELAWRDPTLPAAPPLSAAPTRPAAPGDAVTNNR